MSDEKPTKERNYPVLPDNFQMLKRKEQDQHVRIVVGAMDEILVKANSVAKNNMLSCLERKKKGFAYADNLEEIINAVGPQILAYVQSDENQEVEYVTHTIGINGLGQSFESTSSKTIKGTRDQKLNMALKMAKVCAEHTKIIDSLGSIPDFPTGGNAPTAENGTYDPQDDDELTEFVDES